MMKRGDLTIGVVIALLVAIVTVPVTYCVMTWEAPGSTPTERAAASAKATRAEVEKYKGWCEYWEILADQVDWNYDRVLSENAALKAEITEWEVCAKEREATAFVKAAEELAAVVELNESEPPVFTDQVQESLKGVVHLQCPQWQGSGFVVGPNLIVTARHCVENVEDFLITTNEGHQVRATRAISDKEHDVAFIWVDDLECVAEERGTERHSVSLTPLNVGSIEDCVLGQSVYVIGSPYGKVNINALSLGVISGVNRDWSPLGEHYGWEVAFTVDSAGHPGNSGCPVFSMDGVVRGILVGGFSPVLISVMPCDLFLGDLESIRLMFQTDRYRREEAVEYQGWEGYGSSH